MLSAAALHGLCFQAYHFRKFRENGMPFLYLEERKARPNLKNPGKWYAFFALGGEKGPTKFEKFREMVCLFCAWRREKPDQI
ncbi:MAG TPA: hypothetical protein DF364_05925 [Ruminococcaceae bacterium]|nr:hypothetical protein [Oscillospiraceae bacterium]